MITLSITQEHIDRSNKHRREWYGYIEENRGRPLFGRFGRASNEYISAKHCPLALAANEHYQFEVLVDSATVERLKSVIGDRIIGYHDAQVFIEDFDRGRAVQPREVVVRSFDEFLPAEEQS